MVMKKVLVTGGNGYIGSRLCIYLANQGYAVTPLCYPEAPSDEIWLAQMERVIVADVRDEKFLSKIAEWGYDILIHLVSLDQHQSKGNPSLVSTINIIPTWSLLDIFSKLGLEKFLYFSTMQVYGVPSTKKITEHQKPSSQNAYALTHLAGELICEHYNRVSTTKCRVIRLSNSYGAPIFKENNCWWLVVNELCRTAYYQHKINLQSDGTPLRDFIHGWDVCRAIHAIIETSASHSIYNLSSGKTLSIMEIALKIQKVYDQRYGTKLPIKVAAQTILQKANYQIENKLIRSIGYKPEWNLDRGINDLFSYFEQNNVQ
jgi:nucleoside-diphosphate-sugar epimerase